VLGTVSGQNVTEVGSAAEYREVMIEKGVETVHVPKREASVARHSTLSWQLRRCELTVLRAGDVVVAGPGEG
jgi:hypothetical protein